jgi:uncharacterized protein YbaP (TraB family)
VRGSRAIISLPVLIASFFLFSIPAYAQEKTCRENADYIPIARRMESALLFRITRCGSPDSYVFGTFHSDSPDLNPIIADAKNALSKTRQLALEIVLDDESRGKVRSWLLLPADHPGLQSILGDALFEQVVEKIGPLLQTDAATLDRYKPWALAVLVQYPPPEGDGVVLDEKLQRFAKKMGRKVISVESLEEQFLVFDNMPQTQQIDFLRSTVESIDTLDVMHTELKMHYLARNLPAILAMSDRMFDEMAEKSPELAAYLERHILEQRNERMAERITARLKTPTMVAVGALHLPGETGVLSLLEKDGWQIESVK